MNPIRRAALCALALSIVGALPACTIVKTESDYDPNTDFSVYTTYRWGVSPVANTAEANSELLRGRIERAVDDCMADRGMTKVDEGEGAQLIVTHLISVAERLEVTDPYYAQGPVRTYEEGTLIIDLREADSQALVWRGTGRTRLRNLSSPTEREAEVRTVVSEILKDFPPKS